MALATIGPGEFHKRQQYLSFALLMPAAVAVLALIVYPLYRVVELSLREGRILNFAKIGDLPLGLQNYVDVLTNPKVLGAIWTSFLYVGGSVLFSFLVGLGTALLLNRKLAGNRLFRTLILLPWAVPGVIVAIMFLWLFDGSFGIFNAMLRDIGLLDGDFPWYVDGRTALIAVIVPTIWKSYPLITLTILAALQSVPKDLYEAADIDGATSWQHFRWITWPGIKGPTWLVLMITALGIFRDVDIVFATTGGGPAGATETLALFVYDEAFQFFRMGTASAVGTLMVIIAFVITLVMTGLSARSKF